MWRAKNNLEAIGARVRGAARIIAAFVLSALIVSNAVAQNLGTIFTDDWWNPDESGWGLVVMHQQDFIFATFFVYRSDRSPYWVTAHLQKVGTGGLATAPQVFTGPVYETSGPGFGGAFDPNLVGQVQVGTATFSSVNVNSATLQYSINGVNVTKTIQRQTLRFINYSAQYGGTTVYQYSQCIPSSSSTNGVTATNTSLLTIVQTGQTFHMDTVTQQTNCSFNGTYTQRGSLGRVDGNYSCVNGEAGTFIMSAMQWTLYGMSAGISGQNQFCHFDGFLGGVTGLHIVQ